MVQRSEPEPRLAAGVSRRTAEAGGAALDLDRLTPLMLALFAGSLMIPGSFAFAGVTLTPTRGLLVLYILPLAWRWVSGRVGPVTVVDLLVLLHCSWAAFAILVVHGPSRMIFVTSNFVEIFGAYLVGRTLICNAADFKRLFTYIMVALLCLLPFALAEFLTGTNLLRKLFDPVLSIPPRQSNLGRRLGFTRAQAAFEHPILFGLFCTVVMPVVFFTFRDSLKKRVAAAGSMFFMTFLAISSGPLIGAGLQLMLISWDRMLGFLKMRWVLLGVLGGVIGFFLVVGAQFSVIDFIINNLAFGYISASARVDTFVYGIREVIAHPVFGIGLNEWRMPFWREHPTVDNYWLLIAMRYGVPNLALMVAALALHSFRMAMQGRLTETEEAYRSGYLISLAGVVIVLCTVFIWGATSTFIMTFVGAGAWIYTAPDIVARSRLVPRRGRPAAAAAAAPATPRPAAPPGRAEAAREARLDRRRASYGAPGPGRGPSPTRRRPHE